MGSLRGKSRVFPALWVSPNFAGPQIRRYLLILRQEVLRWQQEFFASRSAGMERAKNIDSMLNLNPTIEPGLPGNAILLFYSKRVPNRREHGPVNPMIVVGLTRARGIIS
jgi:hypothetical protein